MQDPFVVHCHVPKTGGSALNQRLLFPRYGLNRVHQLYRFVFERSSRLPLRHRARAMRCFAAAGHVPFGYVDALYPRALYVSIFREPVARFVSFLNFMVQTPDHKARARLCPGVLAHAADDPDGLVRAVLAEPVLMAVHANCQTRLAAGTARLGTRPVERLHLATALTNLGDPRYLTGTQDRFDALIARLDDTLPGKGPDAPAVLPPEVEKRGTPTIRRDMLAPATLAAIEAANNLDIVLFDRVRRDEPASALAA